jgi:hypothetical protein
MLVDPDAAIRLFLLWYTVVREAEIPAAGAGPENWSVEAACARAISSATYGFGNRMVYWLPCQQQVLETR